MQDVLYTDALLLPGAIFRQGLENKFAVRSRHKFMLPKLSLRAHYERSILVHYGGRDPCD